MFSWGLMAAAACAAVGLGALGVRLKREVPVFQNILFAGILAVILWAPRILNDALVALFLALAIATILSGTAGKVIGVVVGGGAAFVVARVTPGGGPLISLGLVLLFAVVEGRSSTKHLLMLRRARRLDPRTRFPANTSVAIGARAPAAVQTTTLPGIESDRHAAFQIQSLSDEILHAQPDLLVGESEAGAVGVDLARTRLRCSETRLLEGEPAQQLVAALPNASKEQSVVLHTLKPGLEFYVVGAPDWERVASGRGYRESPSIPVFRSTDRVKAVLFDKPEHDAHAQAWWVLARWLVWGTLAAAGIAGLWLSGRIAAI